MSQSLPSVYVCHALLVLSMGSLALALKSRHLFLEAGLAVLTRRYLLGLACQQHSR